MSPYGLAKLHGQQDSSQRTSLLPDKLMRDVIMFIAHRIKYKNGAQQIWNFFILHLISFLLSEKGAFFFF